MKQGGGVVKVVTGDGLLTVTPTDQIVGADGTWRMRNYDRMSVLKAQTTQKGDAVTSEPKAVTPCELHTVLAQAIRMCYSPGTRFGCCALGRI